MPPYARLLVLALSASACNADDDLTGASTDAPASSTGAVAPTTSTGEQTTDPDVSGVEVDLDVDVLDT